MATGRALQRMRLDARLDPALSDRHIVMGGVRLTDPLEQEILDDSFIEQLSVDDLRTASPAVFAQLDRLDRLVDKIYVHIDMDVLDPVEVMGHGSKAAPGQLAKLNSVMLFPNRILSKFSLCRTSTWRKAVGRQPFLDTRRGDRPVFRGS